jgi:hypothetical protein
MASKSLNLVGERIGTEVPRGLHLVDPAGNVLLRAGYYSGRCPNYCAIVNSLEFTVCVSVKLIAELTLSNLLQEKALPLQRERLFISACTPP